MNEGKKKHSVQYYLKRDRWLYLMLLPVLAHYIIFKYLPMGGITIAFQDYNIFKGIFGSEWVGLSVFRKVMKKDMFWTVVKNTLVLNFLTLLVSYPLTIVLSLILNEIRSAKFKKISQSILYLPHFLSWVVVAGLVHNLFNATNGTINTFLNNIGIKSIPFLSDTGWWIVVYVFAHVWKELGWGTIIYLAALSGVDETLYEAAYLDGATKFQRIIHITIPMIKSVMVTMLILNISQLMSIGIDAPMLLGNNKVLDVSEVISTYVYRLGIVRANYPAATAIGLFQSVVNIIILLAADCFAKLIGEEGIL